MPFRTYRNQNRQVFNGLGVAVAVPLQFACFYFGGDGSYKGGKMDLNELENSTAGFSVCFAE
jgi:hypothetical protein